MIFLAVSTINSLSTKVSRNKLTIIRNFSSLSNKELHSCVGKNLHNLKNCTRTQGKTLQSQCFSRKFHVRSHNFELLASINLSLCRNQILRTIFSGNTLKNSVLDVNTNVVKDVILFRYENPKYYKALNAFAFFQFFFWIYLSHFSLTKLKDTPVDKEKIEGLPWWRKINLGENKYRNGITILCFAIGYGILLAAWSFTLKSVRFLVLRKGGESVTFVTYGPFGKNRMMTVPIKLVSCEESRLAARVQLPVKVKDKMLYYMLDMRGEFTNPRLFDHTVGMKRMWPK